MPLFRIAVFPAPACSKRYTSTAVSTARICPQVVGLKGQTLLLGLSMDRNPPRVSGGGRCPYDGGDRVLIGLSVVVRCSQKDGCCLQDTALETKGRMISLCLSATITKTAPQTTETYK